MSAEIQSVLGPALRNAKDDKLVNQEFSNDVVAVTRACTGAGMDILSEAIGSARIGRADVRRVEESGSWGMRFAAFVGSGFHMVLRGSAWLITAAGRPLELRAGDVVVTPFGTEVGFSHTPCLLNNLPLVSVKGDSRSSDQADVEFLHAGYFLDCGGVHPYLKLLPEVLAVSPDCVRASQLRLLAELLAEGVTDTEPGSGATRSALLDLLLTHALRQWLEQDRQVGPPDVGDPAIALALREIHASPQKPWTVQQLSATVRMSRTAFTKRFTVAVGKPPITYLTGWRLGYGARLLQETSAPLAAIARQVGYSTEFAFGAAFRREYGIAPGRFRDLKGQLVDLGRTK
ncbi:AraC family transcriptional regulator [Streptomyces mirabilis]